MTIQRGHWQDHKEDIDNLESGYKIKLAIQAVKIKQLEAEIETTKNRFRRQMEA